MADAVDRLRALCLALPGVSERNSHGGPGWFVRGQRQFVVLDDHHHGADRLAFWCAAPPGAQEALIADDPSRFFRPPYVGYRGWVGVRIDHEPDWDEIAEIVQDAYRQVAPQRLTDQALVASVHMSAADPDDPSVKSAATQAPRLTRIRSGIEKRHGVVGPSLPSDGRHGAEPQASKGGVRMPAKSSQTESDGFSAEERAAMKERAAELRAEGKKGAKKADGLQAVLDRIAEMAPEDRALAERVHVAVTANAPQLSPKTWYGMPAYANADGKVVVFFQDSGKFNYRYSTLGFQDAANLDDGDLWPVSYALQKWSPVVEKKIVELVKAAIA
jgi:uncharacterized protein YdhG (YjbR/CyaY superfamily)